MNLEPKSSASTSSATPAAGPPVGGVYSKRGSKGNPLSPQRVRVLKKPTEPGMATIPPPDSPPESPPLEPGTGGDEIGAPPPDIDIPDPGGPRELPERDEAQPS